MGDLRGKSVHISGSMYSSDFKASHHSCGVNEKNSCAKCNSIRSMKSCQGGAKCTNDCKNSCRLEGKQSKTGDFEIGGNTDTTSYQTCSAVTSCRSCNKQQDFEISRKRSCRQMCNANCQLRKMHELESGKGCSSNCEGTCRMNQNQTCKNCDVCEQEKISCMKACRSNCEQLNQRYRSG